MLLKNIRCVMRKAAVCAAALLLSCAATVRAEGNPDITVLPLGNASVPAGAMERTLRLPQGPTGPVRQPMVFVVGQPWKEVMKPAPLDPNTPNHGETEQKQFPATLNFTVAGKKLPPWELKPYPTAYVINLATIRSNPQFEQGILALTIDLQTEAPGLQLTAYGMPDPTLVDETTDGPLSAIIEGAKDPEVKAYLAAVADDFGGRKAAALAAYDKLATSANARIGAFARRGRRVMRYDARPRRLSGNLNEHERWALFLQQAGLFGPALTEWNECRVIEPDSPLANFKCGEVSDRLAMIGPVVYAHMVRSAMHQTKAIRNEWYALVPILESRGGKKLTNSELSETKNQFLLAQGMIWAATAGQVRLIPSFMIIPDESTWDYGFRGDGVLGPGDGIIAERGWFDSVFSIIPHVDGQEPIKIATLGPDEGPNGTAMTALPHDAGWAGILEAFYQQYVWAAKAGEIGAAFPDVERAPAWGPPPSAGRGYGFRSALAYGFTESMHHRVKISDEASPGNAVRLWRIEGPYAVKDSAPAEGKPGHHVLDPISGNAGSVDLVSDEDFIDLRKIMPNAGWARAVATSWVYSPIDQEVRMWLGQNDGLALWLNGACIHRGEYYSSGNFEDRNLVDTVCSYANLKQGWNELRAVVESWPAPRDAGWGFSVRFCNWDNTPIAGMAYRYEAPTEDLAPKYSPPEAGAYYSWDAVRADYLAMLPRLGSAELAQISGIKGLTLASEIQGLRGYVAMIAPDRKDGPGYRAIRSTWRMDADSDVTLNNVMDTAREAVAALHYVKNGKPHELLMMRVEAVPTYLRLLNEPAAAKAVFGGKPPMDRTLGYVLVRTDGSMTPYIVADVLMSEDGKWPTDEEDVLNPIAPVYIPNKGIKIPTTSKPARSGP